MGEGYVGFTARAAAFDEHGRGTAPKRRLSWIPAAIAASKVYRAAIILATGPIDGYFGSGSGVASQGSSTRARLFKAFLAQLDVPAVIRLAAAEDKAVEIFEALNGRIPTKVEGYKRRLSPDFARRGWMR